MELHPCLTQLIAEASSLSERLNRDDFAFIEPDLATQKTIDERLARWMEAAASGDREEFERRLKWDGWTSETVRQALGAVRLKPTAALPSWAAILNQILTATTGFTSSSLYPLPTDASHPLPFEESVLPVVWVGRQLLLQKRGMNSIETILNLDAYKSLERSLLQSLVRICEKALEQEFSTIRPAGCDLLGFILKETEAPEESSSIYYREFVQKYLEPKQWLLFLQTYPVLGRLMATAVEFWVESTSEFFERLERDKQEIQKLFGGCGKIIELKAALSDFRDCGRSVMVLTFENSVKLVYKPKDLSLDEAYCEFLKWCNESGAPLAFKTLSLLNRGTYGWEEFVAAMPCVDEAAASLFYERAGMLLCVLYLLNATDCHYENVIAHGQYLMLIDAETLLRPPFVNSESSFSFYSVLHTGLLPYWKPQAKGSGGYDVSGLGCPAKERGKLFVRKWRFVNTDQMQWSYEPLEVSALQSAHLPVLQGKTLEAHLYLNELTSGFRQMYLFFLKMRDSGSLPLQGFASCTVRMILRETKSFFHLLIESLSAKNLRSGVERSLEFEVLSRLFLQHREYFQCLSLFKTECAALEQMDIPHVATRATENKSLFTSPPYQALISHIENLSLTDLKQQLSLIQGAFYTQMAAPPMHRLPLSKIEQPEKPPPCLSSQELVRHAAAIASEIEQYALKDRQNHVSWIVPYFDPDINRLQLQPARENLYEGSTGIALFLAALSTTTVNKQFSQLALDSLALVRKKLQNGDRKHTKQFAMQVGIGGLTGLGSVVYALTKISDFLQKPELIENATQAAVLITQESIFADEKLDVTSGSAGALLGLLALFSRTQDPLLLERACVCGEHLVNKRIKSKTGHLTWKGVSERPLTGFSHGAAGIAYSLLRLYEVTGERAYFTAAQDGIAFEQAVFSPEHSNWPDFRSTQEEKTFMTSWCHGAPGIALARLGSLKLLDTDLVQKDIRAGLYATQLQDVGEVDFLCCGACGCIESLWVAGQKYNDSSLKQAAQQLSAKIVARQQKKKTFRLLTSQGAQAIFNPGFYLGTAGIGYQLLRLAEPERFPSILLLE